MSHVAHMNESCRTYEWVMSHIWMSHVAHRNESCRTYERVMSHIWTSHVAHMNKSRHTYAWVTSHVRISHVALTALSLQSYKSCLLSWVTSRKRATNYRALLQKITYADKASHTFLSPSMTTGEQGCMGCLICIGYFLQKSPIISGSFRDTGDNPFNHEHYLTDHSHISHVSKVRLFRLLNEFLWLLSKIYV